MPAIDTSEWKEFVIGKLFDVSRPVPRKQSDYEEGEVPFVASGAFNNGVRAMLKPHNETDIDKGKCLTISPVDGYTFYQEENFMGRGGAGSSIIILRNSNLNRYNGQYLASIIRHIFSSWTYSNMGNADIVKDTLIKLPVDAKGFPDWSYMENYMIEIENRVVQVIPKLNNISKKKYHYINIQSFKRFHLYDEALFVINSGTKLDKIRMTNNNPEINFVGRANANNGVTDFIDRIEGLEPFDAGNMTVSLGGEYLGSCFVQDKPFYTSQNVNVLIPRKEMAYYCKQYIASMIFKEGRLHYKAFIDELNRHMKTDFTIPLPVDSNGDIDWNYMEEYMKKMEEMAREKIRVCM